VHVRAGHLAVGRQPQLDLEQLAAGVSALVCRKVISSPLTGFFRVWPV